MSEENNNQETTEVTNQEALDQFVSLNKGDTVTGTIVKIEDNQAYVSIGYKYDGIIPIRELSSLQVDNAAAAVEVGQEVECKVVSIDDEKEKLVLSKRAIDSENAWEVLEKNFESGEVFEVTVSDVVKGWRSC
ncbi:ribosomal protein S1 [Paenibacillus sp. SORGH_AS338]|nr:ribosomal protein S1 [Paenibacillus sp. SORGH_AS_0338]